MTVVIHGLGRAQMVSHVFNKKSPVASAITTILVKGEMAAERDSRSDKGGKSKTKG